MVPISAKTSLVLLLVPLVLLIQVSQAANYTAWNDEGIIYSAPSGSAYYPSVIYDAGGFGNGTPAYYMWYSDGSGAIFLVKSGNGRNWGAPLTLSGLGNAGHAQVLYDAHCFGKTPCDPVTTKFRMWHWDIDADLYNISAIATAESADGINWMNETPLTQDPAAVLVTGAGTGWNRGSYGPIYLFYRPNASNTGIDPWNHKYAMYYDATDGTSEVIGLAYSDDGYFWAAYTGNPVLAGSSNASWDCTGASYGTARHDSSGYSFWYSGGGGDDGSGGCALGPINQGIGYASSTDGKTWVKSSGPIFSISDGVVYRNQRVYTPSVVDDSTGALKMYYTALGPSGTKNIGLATLAPANPPTPKILTFKEDAAPAFPALIGDQAYVIMDNVNYKMYYVCGTNWGICLAQSPDGITWTPYGTELITGEGYHTDVKFYDAGFPGAEMGSNQSSQTMHYRMWYAGTDGHSIGGWRYAESPDGKNWFNRMPITQYGPQVFSSSTGVNYGIADVVYTPNASNTGTDWTFRVYANAQWEAGNYSEGRELVLMAFSTNGYNWTGYDPTGVGYATPVFAPTLDISGFDAGHIGWFKVIKNSPNDWEAFYSGGNDTTYQALNGIGYATSVDGIHWIRRQTLFTSSDGVPWRNESVWMPSVVRTGSIYQIWFLGSDNPDIADSDWIQWKVGHATIGIYHPPAPSGGGSGSLKSFNLAYTFDCPDCWVTFNATSSGKPLSDVSLRVIYDTPPEYYLVLDLTTDSDGLARIMLSSDGRYRVYAKRNGFRSIETDFDFTECPIKPECVADSGCGPSERCVNQTCSLIQCQCGQAANHSCTPYPCCSDSQCTDGGTCINHSCKPKACSPPGCCGSDEDCASAKKCDKPTTATTGSCRDISVCGLVQNHSVIQTYECGPGLDCPICPSTKACEDNKCVQYSVQCQPSASVGDRIICSVTRDGKACIGCNVSLTDPSGARTQSTTDSSAQFAFNPDKAGNYTMMAQKGQAIIDVKTILVPASVIAPVSENCLFAGVLLIIAVAAAFWYWRRRKRKK
jgi:hypothetical protein